MPHIIKILIILLFISFQSSPQSKDTESFSGIFTEYNTLILTHNLKLYSDFNFYTMGDVIIGVQPGAEIIYSLPGAEKNIYSGSPYYDFNILGIVTLFPDYKISIKPFAGACYSYRPDSEKDYSLFFVKYGTTIQLNISEHFKIIAKVMNVPKNTEYDISVLLGAGFLFKL